MLSLKVSLLAVVLFAVCNCEQEIASKSDAHNIIHCINPEKEKVLLEAQPISVPGSLWQVKRKTVVYPSQGINNKKISCIKVLDRDQNGKGAFPKIISGGLQYFDVTIEIVSQVSRGINHNIEIYADKQ